MISSVVALLPSILISFLISPHIFSFFFILPPLFSLISFLISHISKQIHSHTHIRNQTHTRTNIQRLLVSVDRWPADSLSPLGHYVRVLGKDGEKDVETQVTISHPYSSLSFCYSYYYIRHDLFTSELEQPFSSPLILSHLFLFVISQCYRLSLFFPLHCLPSPTFPFHFSPFESFLPLPFVS